MITTRHSIGLSGKTLSKMGSEAHDKTPGDLLPKEDTVLSSAASFTQVAFTEISWVWMMF